MRSSMVCVVLILRPPLNAAFATMGSSRVCIEREEQNGSLNISPTIISIRSKISRKVVAHKRFDDAEQLCADLPRGRYILIVKIAKPWVSELHWWTRRYPLNLRAGGANYVMTNPSGPECLSKDDIWPKRMASTLARPSRSVEPP